jgi:hypothetical protein
MQAAQGSHAKLAVDGRAAGVHVGDHGERIARRARAMARIVTLTITYDVDDEGKSLSEELANWTQGDVNVLDFVWNEGGELKTSREGAVIAIREGE